jgi:UDP-3-O-[3-hydroxymyristoyl] glucosamine N-acyltransferase
VNTVSLTAGRIADLVGGELIGAQEIEIVGVAPLDRAGPHDVSFLSRRRYASQFTTSRAGLVIVPDQWRAVDGPANRVVVPDPRVAMARVLDCFTAKYQPTWTVAPDARVGRGVRWRGRISIGAGAVIADDVAFGEDCEVGPYCVIGRGARLGRGCRLHAHVTIDHGVELGERVLVHAGARIGTPGFGYVTGDDGVDSIPHAGPCLIGDDVRIGANTTIDRGSVGATSVGNGTKIDNLVQVGHNTSIGRRCFIMAQVGMAGSTVVEDDVILAGQAGLAGHLTIGRGAKVAAQAGVIGDIPAGLTVSGYPARPHREMLRQAAALRRLAPSVATLESLVKQHGGST